MRFLPVAWCSVSAVVASLLGVGGASLKTDAGRRVVVRSALRAANGKIHGRLTVGSVGGSWLGGLDAHDLVLSDSAGAVVVMIRRLGASYQLRDLVGGRLTLGELTIDTPTVHLVERASGRLNIEEILGVGSVGGKAASSPLIAFRDVVVRHGAVTIRAPLAPGDSAPDVTMVGGARFRVRHIDGLDAVLPYMRLASPLPRDVGIHVEVQRLAARVSDPALDLRGAQGTVDIRGDTVALDLGDARLPQSVARVRGTLRNASGGLGLNLTVQATTGASEDVRGLAPQLPGGVDARGRFVLKQDPGGPLSVSADPVTLVGRYGGGSATGRLGMVVGPAKAWGLRDTRLTLDRFNLGYLRSFLDTLPVAGRVTGAFSASGDHTALTTDLDVSFEDSLVAGRPVSTVQAGGVVHLGVPGNVVFEGFAVRAAHVELGTVRRLVPSVRLRGIVDAAGTLDGAWKNATFSGTLRHQDATGPASLARGVVRLDTRRDTVGVWANLRVDSLDLTGIASQLRGLPVRGAFAGEVRLAGYADQLNVQVDLAGPAGGMKGTGVFTVVPPRVAVHDLDLTTRALNLHGLHARSLGSSLFAHVTGFVELDTLTAPRASVVTTLGASWLGGAPLDSARATLVARDSLLGTDSLHVWGPGGLDVDVRGRLRLAGASPDDSLLIRANTDSLSLVAPLLVALVPSLGDLPDSVGGAVSVVASTHGNPAALVVRGTAGASSFRWGVATARGVRVLGQWSDDQTVPMSLRAEARAILLGRFTFLRPLVTIDGAPDSIIWRARSALGPDASWAGAGQLVPRDHGLDIPMDSLVLTLPDQAWRLDSLARFGVRDSTVLLSHVAFHATTGPGSLSVSGIHPRLGSGDIAVNLTAVPLPDIWALIQRDPAEVGGLVSGAVGLKGELHTPAMSATITVQDGKFGEFVAPRVTASLDYHDHRLGGQLDLYKDALRTMDVGIDLPLDLALVSVAQRQLPGALTVRAHTDSLDLAFLEAFSPNVRATSGTLRADVSINGSWDAPVLRGAVAVTDGGVSLPALGARYDDIYARLTLSGDTIRVDSLSASGEKGTASARGTVRLVQLTQPVLRLDIDANDFRALNIRNFLELAGTGQLHLEGPAIGATLTGRATVTRGVLYFADLITKNVVNLDALDEALGDSTLKAAVERQGLGPEFQSRFLDSLRIDTMAVEMGSEVWLRSSEANIALTGQVTVGKTANRYRVDGILETPRGTYRLPIPLGVQTINRDFTVTRGRVQYFGTADLNAVLDVDAQHVVRTTKGESVTTFVNIGGTLYVPKLTLSSDVRPAISETEIMSYLLFGAPSLASMQGSPLQHAVSEYVGVLSGQLESTLISDLRVPLDYLSIRTGDAGVGGTEIAAGRQVGAFFLTVSQRVCPGQTAISNLGGSLEYRFSREWRMAFSRDAVHGCDFLVGQGAPVSYQVGLDLIWEMSH